LLAKNAFMKVRNFIITLFSASLIFLLFSNAMLGNFSNKNILSYTVNLSKEEIRFYWKDDKGAQINSLKNLNSYTKRQRKNLLFAMNGGMYMEDYSPLGLYIEAGKTMKKQNNAKGTGNFYLKPNGIFYLKNDNTAGVVKTSAFKSAGVTYATQSGPMLVVDGKIHTAFSKVSTHLNIRNGVGILPDKRVLFAISKEPISFYDFAKFFLDAGCKNALYLDGAISCAYSPAQKWTAYDGNFGVIIGVTSK